MQGSLKVRCFAIKIFSAKFLRKQKVSGDFRKNENSFSFQSRFEQIKTKYRTIRVNFRKKYPH